MCPPSEHSDASEPLPPTPNNLLEVVDRFEKWDQITDHPYMLRLRQGPVNLYHLWLLLANFQVSISKSFAKRLANLTARVDDDRIRCLLAEQLNDEMGAGRFERAHTNLFTNMMNQLQRWRPPVVDERTLAPGLRLDPRLAEIYDAADVHVGLGAIIAGEIFGKQMDQFIADEFRRQSEIDPSSLEWLMIHEQLEVEHADASPELARLIPATSVRQAWQGAWSLSQAGRAFLNDLQSLCYGDA